MKRTVFVLAFAAMLLLLAFVVEGGEIYNNGGYYLGYGDQIYYRRYQSDFWPESDLWGRSLLDSTPGAALFCLDQNGESRVLVQEPGARRLFSYRDPSGELRMLLTKDGEDEFLGVQSAIYSIDFQGNERNVAYGGPIFALDEDRLLIIQLGYRGMIGATDLNSGEYRCFVEAYHVPVYYDLEEGLLYCLDNSGFSENLIEVVEIDVVDGRIREVFSASGDRLAELNPKGRWGWNVEIRNAYTSPEHLYLYLSFSEGGGDLSANSVLLEIDREGGNCEALENPRAVNWFGVGTVFSPREDSPFYEDLPGYYIFPDEEGEREEVLSPADLAEVGLPLGAYFGAEEFADLADLEYVDGTLFFTVVKGPRNREKEWDGEYAYDQGEISVYRKDLQSGTISLLYALKGSEADSFAQYLAFLQGLSFEDPDFTTRAVQKFLQIAPELSGSEIDAIFLTLDNYLAELADFLSYQLFEHELLGKLQQAVSDEEGIMQRGLLERLNDPGQVQPDPNLQGFRQQIFAQGLRFSMAEGSLFFQVRPGFLVEPFALYLSEADQKYASLVEADEKAGFLEDGGLLISFAELGRRLVVWDQFLLNHPEFLLREQAQDRYESYLGVFLQGVDNFPVFRGPNQELDSEIKEVYLDFIAENANSATGQLVAQYYQLLEEEGFRNTAKIQNFYWQH